MTSQFEDTKVGDLDVSDLSDEQLRDIADNDSRKTAQEKAQAELNRREDGDGSDTRGSSNTPDEAPVKDAAGYETSPLSEESGARQVQAKLDQANTSGWFPGDGNPPSGDHTLAAVTQIPQHADQEPGLDPADK